MSYLWHLLGHFRCRVKIYCEVYRLLGYYRKSTVASVLQRVRITRHRLINVKFVSCTIIAYVLDVLFQLTQRFWLTHSLTHFSRMSGCDLVLIARLVQRWRLVHSGALICCRKLSQTSFCGLSENCSRVAVNARFSKCHDVRNLLTAVLERLLFKTTKRCRCGIKNKWITNEVIMLLQLGIVLSIVTALHFLKSRQHIM